MEFEQWSKISRKNVSRSFVSSNRLPSSGGFASLTFFRSSERFIKPNANVEILIKYGLGIHDPHCILLSMEDDPSKLPNEYLWHDSCMHLSRYDFK